jgi:hypothetical protein
MSRNRRDTRMPVRRRVALVGVAAILFQALLFGWHHHGLRLATRGEPVSSVSNALRQMPATAAEDSCEICAVLHHQNASPLAFAMPPAPSVIASAIELPAPDFLDPADTRWFHARAPPRA